jgi:hypothetical protein
VLIVDPYGPPTTKLQDNAVAPDMLADTLRVPDDGLDAETDATPVVAAADTVTSVPADISRPPNVDERADIVTWCDPAEYVPFVVKVVAVVDPRNTSSTYTSYDPAPPYAPQDIEIVDGAELFADALTEKLEADAVVKVTLAFNVVSIKP